MDVARTTRRILAAGCAVEATVWAIFAAHCLTLGDFMASGIWVGVANLFAAGAVGLWPHEPETVAGRPEP